MGFGGVEMPRRGKCIQAERGFVVEQRMEGRGDWSG